MTHEERWSRPHPLCTCTEMTFSGPMPDRAECRRKAYPIDPHPVLTEADMHAAITLIQEQRSYRA